MAEMCAPAIGNERSLEAAVAKYFGQPATFRPSLFYGGDPTEIVRYAGSDNDYRHEQAKGVNNPERFPADIFLPASYPLLGLVTVAAPQTLRASMTLAEGSES